MGWERVKRGGVVEGGGDEGTRQGVWDGTRERRKVKKDE